MYTIITNRDTNIHFNENEGFLNVLASHHIVYQLIILEINSIVLIFKVTKIMLDLGDALNVTLSVCI